MSVQTHISLAWQHLRRQRRLKQGSLLNDHEIISIDWCQYMQDVFVTRPPQSQQNSLQISRLWMIFENHFLSFSIPVSMENAREFVKGKYSDSHCNNVCSTPWNSPHYVAAAILHARSAHLSLLCPMYTVGRIPKLTCRNWCDFLDHNQPTMDTGTCSSECAAVVLQIVTQFQFCIS